MRSMAARHGIGKDTVARIWRDHNLQPWRVDRFKVSNDPRFEEKGVDVVGLYSNPPERAPVFSFDEKTQCQALDRTQPSLPLRPGRAGTMTSTTAATARRTCFAALNVATGEVITDCRKRHSGADVLRFFKLIDLHVPGHLDLHAVLDDLSAHTAPEVQEVTGSAQARALAPALHPDQLELGERGQVPPTRQLRTSSTVSRSGRSAFPGRCRACLPLSSPCSGWAWP